MNDLTINEKLIFIDATLMSHHIDGKIEILFNDKKFNDIIKKIKIECNNDQLKYLNNKINFYKNL